MQNKSMVARKTESSHFDPKEGREKEHTGKVLTSKPALSDTSSNKAIYSNSSQTVPPIGDEVLKYVDPWGPFSNDHSGFSFLKK